MPAQFLRYATVEGTLRGWIVQGEIRMTRGLSILCIRIITPDGEATDLAAEAVGKALNVRAGISTQLSPAVGLIFRANITDAKATRCINALRRVVAAAHATTSETPREVVRLMVECSAHDADPEQVQNFRDASMKARAKFVTTQISDSYLPTDLIVAFMEARWTPQHVAEFHQSGGTIFRNGREWGQVRLLSATWIRSTTTRTVCTTEMLGWATGQKLRGIRPSDMVLARRYRAAGWTFEQMAEVSMLSRGTEWYKQFRTAGWTVEQVADIIGLSGDHGWFHHVAKAWCYLPSHLGVNAARAGLTATEAKTLFNRGDLNEHSVLVLAALRTP